MTAEEKIRQIVPDWEQVRNLIMPRVVHRDVDISNYVGRERLDMKEYAVIPLDDGITVKVTPSLCELWQKAEADVIKQMTANAAATCEDIDPKPLSHVIRDLAGIEMTENPGEPVILTNPEKCFGAYTMLDFDLMNRVARHFDAYELIVLPSSVHEVLVMPLIDEADIPEFDAMVREVNETQVDPEEWLSDHAYVYTVSKSFRW